MPPSELPKSLLADEIDRDTIFPANGALHTFLKPDTRQRKQALKLFERHVVGSPSFVAGRVAALLDNLNLYWEILDQQAPEDAEALNTFFRYEIEPAILDTQKDIRLRLGIDW